MPRFFVQPDIALGIWVRLDVFGSPVYFGADQPETAPGVLQPRARWPYLRRHRDELSHHHIWSAIAHGLSCFDQASAFLRRRKHPPTLPHSANAGDRSRHRLDAPADDGKHWLGQSMIAHV